MSTRRISFVLAALLLAMPGLAWSGTTVVAGTFDGSEPRGAPLPGSCGGEDPIAYIVTGDLRVSVTGDYTVYDALWLNGIRNGGLDVAVTIYNGPFNIGNPGQNLVTPGGIDYIADVNLQAGVNYTLVVQQWCENREGAWGLSISGPGDVTSAWVANTPPLSEGSFAATDPTATTACSNGQYVETGPIQVARSGTYYYTDVSWYAGFFDVCVLVYEGDFDPARPELNRVPAVDPWSGADYLDDDGTIELEAGKSYTFVVQPLGVAAVGEYFFVLAPPAPFRISKALAGAWYNPVTDGQGFFIDVFDNLNLMFLSWFTFDLSRPVDGTAQLGEPGHRWLTALGEVEGGTATLDVYLARGGVFDAAEPEVEGGIKVGTMEVNFDSCISGTVDYALTEPVVSGQVPIEPVAGVRDHVELCESLTKGPGVPGPL